MSSGDKTTDSKVKKMSVLDQLKKHTVIVADTGDFEGELSSIYNPSLWRSSLVCETPVPLSRQLTSSICILYIILKKPLFYIVAFTGNSCNSY